MANSAPAEQLYTYTGITRTGKKIKGTIESQTETSVKQALRRQGIRPKSVRKKQAIFGIGGGRRTKRIKAKDIAVFSRQMATIIAAGVPMVEALDIIARGSDNKSMTSLVNTIRSDIQGGDPFATALSRHPKYFDELYVNLVSAGEQSGQLEQLLERIATYKEKTEAIKSKVRKALIYPAAVLTVAIVVMVVMLVFVVPQFQSLFTSFGANLPSFTLLVISLSETMQRWWYVVIGGLGAAIWLLVRARRRSRSVRRTTDVIAMKIPVVGDILYKAAVARYARTLSTMFAAGVPLVEALRSVGRVAGNMVFEEAIAEIREEVAAGIELHAAMTNRHLFPTMALQMVGIGEKSGALDDMCARVASAYEDEVDESVDNLSSLLEPMIMVVIGVLVGGLIIAMYLPIFKLGSVVG